MSNRFARKYVVHGTYLSAPTNEVETTTHRTYIGAMAQVTKHKQAEAPVEQIEVWKTDNIGIAEELVYRMR